MSVSHDVSTFCQGLDVSEAGLTHVPSHVPSREVFARSRAVAHVTAALVEFLSFFAVY